MKLYIISDGDGKQKGESNYILATEKGELIYQLYSNNYVFAYLDIMEECQDYLKERFDNYQVLFLGQDDMTLDKLFKRHKIFKKVRK